MTEPEEEKNTDEPEGLPAPATSQRKGRRRGFFKWAGVLFGSLLIVAVAGAWLAYVKRTVILNSFLRDAAAPYTIAAGKFDFDRNGNLDIYDLKLEGDGENAPTISIPHAEGVVDFRDAVDGKWVSINIHHPVIRIPIGALTETDDASGLGAIDEDVTSIAPAVTSPYFALEKLSIDDAQIMIGDVLTARFDYDADTLALFDDGTIETRRHHLSLRDIRFALPGNADAQDADASGEWAAIPSATAEFSIYRDGRIIRLHSLDIPEAKAQVNEALLQWLTDEGFIETGAAAARISDGDTAQPAKVATASAVPFSDLIVEKMNIGALQFQANGIAGWPSLAGSLTLESDGLRIPFSAEFLQSELRFQDQRISVNDAVMFLPEREESEAFVRIPELSVVVNRGDDLIYEVDHIGVDGAMFEVTPEIVDFFAGEGFKTGIPASGARSKDQNPSDPNEAAKLRIKAATLENLSLQLSGFAEANDQRSFFLPNITGIFAAVLRDWEISSAAMHSSARQELFLTDLRAMLADEVEIAALCSGQIVVVPDELLSTGQLVKCRFDSFDLGLTEPFWAAVEAAASGSAGDLDTAGKTATTDTEDSAVAGTDERPPWMQVTAQTFEVHDGFFRMVQKDPEIPNVEGKVAISTRAGTAAAAPIYEGLFSDLVFHAPADASKPFAHAQSLAVVADSAALWSEKKITTATLRGAELRVGEQFETLLEEVIPVSTSVATDFEAGADETSSAAPVEQVSQWRVGTFRIEDSVVVVEDFAPLIPDIPLAVQTMMTDFPLTKEEFYLNEEPMKVEVANIRIPSPYGYSRTPVADLDSVFIHFTLAGLMRDEIDKVEVLHPTIYVGENLFWYIEFFRNSGHSASATQTSGDGTTAAADGAISAAEIPDDDQASQVDDQWNIGKIDAFYGQLIIALDGRINPELPAFPFSCSTALDQGTLSATLDIPAGTYKPIEGVDLEVKVTGGTVDFNLPLGQDANNLVETFLADELRYRQFLATDVHLSLTYDQYGIYAKYGGATYDGYTNGEFNLYINDDFTWDGWVSGTKVSATEMTRVLTPEYYLMSGNADFKVIAQGDLDSLYQGYGDFKMDKPGIISVPALDSLKGKFPEDWTRLESSLAEIGVESLRDLPYESCAADFKIFEREGTLNLKADGSDGTRSLVVAIHDYRLPAPAKILELAYGSDDGAHEHSRPAVAISTSHLSAQ